MLHQSILATEGSSKYLGVTISHGSTLMPLPQKVIALLRRNLHGCTSQVKASVYTTLVRPSLEYASSVWDPAIAADAHSLEVSTYVTDRFTDRTPGCVTQMIVNLGWQSLQHRRYLARIIMLFKINNGVVLVSDSPLSTRDNRTRVENRFHQIRSSANLYKNSFFPTYHRRMEHAINQDHELPHHRGVQGGSREHYTYPVANQAVSIVNSYRI